MCKISVGSDIHSLNDVQNLITGYIFRERYPYNISTLTQKVIESCKGSSLDISETTIKDLVLDTNMTFLRTERIDSYNGQYFVRKQL